MSHEVWNRRRDTLLWTRLQQFVWWWKLFVGCSNLSETWWVIGKDNNYTCLYCNYCNYICIHALLTAYMIIYIYISVNPFAHIYIYIYMLIYIYIIYIYIYMYIYIIIHTHYSPVYMYIYIYTQCVFIHTCKPYIYIYMSYVSLDDACPSSPQAGPLGWFLRLLEREPSEISSTRHSGCGSKCMMACGSTGRLKSLNIYASMGQSMGCRWIKARNQIFTSWKFKFQFFLCAVHCYGVLRWNSKFRCLRIIMLLSWLKFELLLQYESCYRCSSHRFRKVMLCSLLFTITMWFTHTLW